MNETTNSPSPPELSLAITRALFSEAAQRPWLAALLMRRSQWLIELVLRLRALSRHTRRILRRALATGMSATALILALIWTQPARAGTIVVDGTTCSLANAITTANSGSDTGGCTGGSAGADTIDLQTNVTLTSALPNITSEIVLEGNGHTIERDSGASSFRILFVHSSGKLTLKEATIKGGGGVNWAGGIHNDGTLTIQKSTITGNTATLFGGGIYNWGTLNIQNSTISGNSSSDGGGIYNAGSSSSLTVENSTISGNTATSQGGGVFFKTGSSEIKNSTITGNTALIGGGIYIEDTLYIQNSIVALQTSGVDCSGSGSNYPTSMGYNIESGTSCGFTSTGDQQNVGSGSLNLGALATNGGPTKTHALGSGSAAIDQIPDGTNGCVAGTSTDQRGAVRAGQVTSGDHRGGTACDIGAYEYDSNETPSAVMLKELTASIVEAPGILAGFSAALAGVAAWVSIHFRRRKTAV